MVEMEAAAAAGARDNALPAPTGLLVTGTGIPAPAGDNTTTTPLTEISPSLGYLLRTPNWNWRKQNEKTSDAAEPVE